MLAQLIEILPFAPFYVDKGGIVVSQQQFGYLFKQTKLILNLILAVAIHQLLSLCQKKLHQLTLDVHQGRSLHLQLFRLVQDET
jgi:hypothetical protein